MGNNEKPPSIMDIHYALGQSYYKLNKKKKVKEILDILYMLDRGLYERLSMLISEK